jgi:hypothetical protein
LNPGDRTEKMEITNALVCLAVVALTTAIALVPRALLEAALPFASRTMLRQQENRERSQERRAGSHLALSWPSF